MKTAFTLIELLIVVSVIGILATIAIPNFLNAQIKAKIAHAQADMKTIFAAAQLKTIDQKNFHNVMGDCQSYKELTTPIAYLSNIDAVYDHFRPMDPDIEDQRFYQPGANCYFFHWGDRISVRRFNKHFTELPVLIFSVGPNQIRDNFGVFNQAHYPFTAVSSFGIYDCTNGLFSNGDVVWTNFSPEQVFINGNL